MRATNPSIHNECIYAIVRAGHHRPQQPLPPLRDDGPRSSPTAPGGRRSRPAYGKVTLENNVFGHTYKDDGTWHYYSLYVANTANAGGTLDGWMVRNNTFEIAGEHRARTPPADPAGSATSAAGTACRGMRYSHNVGEKCAATRQGRLARGVLGRAWPRRSAGSTPARSDFRLKAGSPAINAADPADHPATDRDGFVRDGRPDAGAHEFGAGPPGGRRRAAPAEPGRRAHRRSGAAAVRSARLRPRVICKRPRGAPARRPRGSARGVVEGPRVASGS